MRRPVLVLFACLAAAACRSTPDGPAAVGVSPMVRPDPLEIHDELEALIATGSADEGERARAYRRARLVIDDGSAGYAFARAALAGRLAETRGIKSVRLVKEAETWARRSLERDPDFRDGAAQRLLGSLYVMAPAKFLAHGDSERGLELLETLTDARPSDPLNHLRLAEAYVFLGDPDPAGPHLCEVIRVRDSLRDDDQKLLVALLEEVDEAELACTPSAAADPSAS